MWKRMKWGKEKQKMGFGSRDSGLRIPDEKGLSGCPMPEAQCRRIAPPINKSTI
jgi:hypothetical protein